MALEKTITANGSRGHHKFTLKVVEDRTDTNNSYLSFTFVLSPIVRNYDWSSWGSRISYSITIGTNTYTGTIPSYNGTSTVTLKSGTNIQIEHDSDGTKTINVAFNVYDTAGQSYTPGNASASSTFTLSVLHTPPEINSVNITEIDSTMSSLGIANNVIVQFLSKKTFTLTSTFYDDATISNFSIYHNNVLIGTSSTNEVTVDFSNVGELITTQNIVGLMIQVTDSLNGISSQMFNYDVIKYAKPTIEATSTTIKRKTGNGTVLTDNKANLNYVGTAYKESNIIGNNNTPIVEYKIWNTTEPQNYTQVQATISGNNITVTNYEITNVDYTKVYYYKIRTEDSFGNYDEKEGKIPTGTSVWTEYKDRVDFLKAQVGGKDVVTDLNFITVTNENDQTIAGNNTIVKYLLNEIVANNGDKLTFNTTDNSVDIGANVSYVEISAQIYVFTRGTDSLKTLYIYKNNEQVARFSQPMTDDYWSITIGSFIIPVQQGDKITMRFRSGAGSTVLGGSSLNAGANFLTIKVLK